MPLKLTENQVRQYERDGCLFPIPVFGHEAAQSMLARLEAIEAGRAGGRLPPFLNLKAHLVIPWLWDVVHDPRIVDAVEDVLGPNLLCWAAGFFNKEPSTPSYVAWHQDGSYWGLSEPRALTAWVAFTPSAPENGCMQVIPATNGAAIAHHDTFERHNMLAGRETISVEIDESRAMSVVLAPGEMSLHDPLVIHGSKPNPGPARRVGFVIRYIAADVRQTGSVRASATLVRGRDFGNYDLEQEPEGDLHPAAVARHTEILRNWGRMIAGNAKRFNSAMGIGAGQSARGDA